MSISSLCDSLLVLWSTPANGIQRKWVCLSTIHAASIQHIFYWIPSSGKSKVTWNVHMESSNYPLLSPLTELMFGNRYHLWTLWGSNLGYYNWITPLGSLLLWSEPCWAGELLPESILPADDLLFHNRYSKQMLSQMEQDFLC